MKRIDVDDVRVAGALDRDETADGIVFRRLPGWTRHQIMDIQLGFVITMPAGVRLEFVTNATEIEVDVLLTRLELGGRPAKAAAFDLVVDGALVDSQASESGHLIRIESATQPFDFVPGDAATIRFADAPTNGSAPVELWLPQDAVVELRALRVSDGATLECREVGLRRWVHHGSSISHCLEARRPTETWPAIAARRARVDLLNLGFGGQCMLDQMVARTLRDVPESTS